MVNNEEFFKKLGKRKRFNVTYLIDSIEYPKGKFLKKICSLIYNDKDFTTKDKELNPKNNSVIRFNLLKKERDKIYQLIQDEHKAMIGKHLIEMKVVEY